MHKTRIIQAEAKSANPPLEGLGRGARLNGRVECVDGDAFKSVHPESRPPPAPESPDVTHGNHIGAVLAWARRHRSWAYAEVIALFACGVAMARQGTGIIVIDADRA
jgi:hypothetical protein